MTTRPVSKSNRKTTPPKYKEGISYKSWKNKIQMGQLVREQAIVVLLESLDNNTKAKKVVSEFTATEHNSDGGMGLLIANLVF